MKTIIINILILFVLCFSGCDNPVNQNERALIEMLAKRLGRQGDEVFCNKFLHWDAVHGKLHHLFYKDSLPNELYLGKQYAHLKEKLISLNYEKVRQNIAKTSPTTLKEYIPDLVGSINIVDRAYNELISNYIENSYKKGKSYSHVFFANPIFTEEKFAFIYFETFTSPESAGGQVNVYYYDENKWQKIGSISTFVS